MRIVFRKLSDERHALEIAREDGSRERIECETRSYLLHDLLHYAVESEARLEVGFWPSLARGETLAAMNDRTGASATHGAGELQTIECIVGALTGAAKGQPASETGLQTYFAATATPMPPWLTVTFIASVQERMRRLLGAWTATRYGEALLLTWPERRPLEDSHRPMWRGRPGRA